MGIEERSLKDGTRVYVVREYTGFTYDGVRDRMSVTCRTKAEARKVQARLRAGREAMRGRSGRLTFRAYVEGAWWPSLTRLAASSRDTYEREVRLRLLPAFGETDIRDINRAAIQSMVSSCETEGVARKALGVLKTILNEAKGDGLLLSNPAEARYAMPPKGRKRDEGVVVTRFGDMLPILAAVEGYGDPEYAKLAATGFLMGLRPEERYGLDWEDFDRGMTLVRVRRAYTAASAREGGNDLKCTKTPLSARTVPVPPRARFMLCGMERGEGPFVVGSNGKRITPSTAQNRCRAFNRWAAERGLELPYVTLENMRHSFATSYLHAGGNVEDLSRLLGHSDINTTFRKYVKPSDEDLVRGMSAVVSTGV